MKLDKNGDYLMNKKEIGDFSSWLDKHPRERYKRFNEVVQNFMSFNKYASDKLILKQAQ